jgi:hypothetical protein
MIHPAAYGDLGANFLAVIAALAVHARASRAIPLVWLFNVWGFADLSYAVTRA